MNETADEIYSRWESERANSRQRRIHLLRLLDAEIRWQHNPFEPDNSNHLRQTLVAARRELAETFGLSERELEEARMTLGPTQCPRCFSPLWCPCEGANGL